MATQRRKDNKNRVLKEGEYQRENGLYEFKWRDSRGKRHSIYSMSLEDLRDKELDVLKDTLDGIKKDNNLTLNDFYYRWRDIKRGLKDTTFQNYNYMYRMFVESDFGKIKISKIKKSDIRAFYNRLHEELSLKINTIDTIHTVLHQVLDIAVEDEYLRNNPSDKALTELKRTTTEDSQRVRALTVEEQEIFEQYLATSPKHIRWLPIFTVMLWTGMRVGEATGLRWCDIDFENNLISVNHTLVYFDRGGEYRCGFAVNTPKTKAGCRMIPMIPKVREALLKEKEFCELCDVKCTADYDGFTDFVFLNRFGNTHNQATLNRALKRIVKDCNFKIMDQGDPDSVILPRFSNHWLRHTFATRMVEAKLHPKAMQDILGHQDIETTMNIYAEATTDFTTKEMMNFSEFYSRFRMANETECEVRPMYENGTTAIRPNAVNL